MAATRTHPAFDWLMEGSRHICGRFWVSDTPFPGLDEWPDEVQIADSLGEPQSGHDDAVTVRELVNPSPNGPKIVFVQDSPKTRGDVWDAFRDSPEDPSEEELADALSAVPRGTQISCAYPFSLDEYDLENEPCKGLTTVVAGLVTFTVDGNHGFTAAAELCRCDLLGLANLCGWVAAGAVDQVDGTAGNTIRELTPYLRAIAHPPGTVEKPVICGHEISGLGSYADALRAELELVEGIRDDAVSRYLAVEPQVSPAHPNDLKDAAESVQRSNEYWIGRRPG